MVCSSQTDAGRLRGSHGDVHTTVQRLTISQNITENAPYLRLEEKPPGTANADIISF